MAKLPKINLDDVRPVALWLPKRRYQVKLVEIEKFTAKSNRPCLRWWWEIVKGRYKGKQIASYTGNGTKESHSLMNLSLKRHLKALGTEYTEGLDFEEFLNMKVTIDTDEDEYGSPVIIIMMPASFYQYNPNWKPDGWYL